MAGRLLVECAGKWTTTKIAAGNPAGSASAISFSASTPPAEAPITTIPRVSNVPPQAE
jgi:hypothetical protein